MRCREGVHGTGGGSGVLGDALAATAALADRLLDRGGGFAQAVVGGARIVIGAVADRAAIGAERRRQIVIRLDAERGTDIAALLGSGRSEVEGAH